jgi:polyribonucleotide nucleotidyltransferase
MDAGVAITKPVSGIAMGLISEIKVLNLLFFLIFLAMKTT